MAVSSNDIVAFDVTEEVLKKANLIENISLVDAIGEVVFSSALDMVLGEQNNWDVSSAGKDPTFHFCNRNIGLITIERIIPIKPWYKIVVEEERIPKKAEDIVLTSYDESAKKLYVLGVMKANMFFDLATVSAANNNKSYALMVSRMTPVRDYLKDIKVKFLTMKQVA